MRVAFVGQSGPYAPPALRRLLQGAATFELVGVVEGLRPGGTRVVNSLRGGGGGDRNSSDLSQVAAGFGVSCLCTSDINSLEAHELITAMEPDLLVCVGFDRLFKNHVLRIAPYALNAHPSLLPALRGPSPIYWSARQGGAAFGQTLHVLEPTADSGAIVAQRSLQAPNLASGRQWYAIAGEAAGDMLREVMGEVPGAFAAAVPQDHNGATPAPRPSPRDARVDPAEWTAQRFANFVSVASYFVPAWMELGGARLTIRSAQQVELGKTVPGHYVQMGSTMVVQCRDGIVHLHTMARPEA